MSEHTDKLRPVEINGHQEFYTGYFHAWAGLSEHPTAIIETSNGRIKIVPAVQVTFTGIGTECNDLFPECTCTHSTFGGIHDTGCPWFDIYKKQQESE